MLIQQTKKPGIAFADSFKEDVIALFSGEQSSNLQNYLYGQPLSINDPVKGANIFDNILEKYPDYYLYRNEIALINQKAESVAQILGQNTTLIDYGPGPARSFIAKTLPIVQLMDNLKGYIAVDVCNNYLEDCQKVIRKTFPSVHSESIVESYYDARLNFSFYQKPVVYFSGSSICNCPGDDLRNYETELVSRLELIRSQLGKHGTLIITQDSNQDRQLLIKAYSGSYGQEFILNVLFRIKRDLKTENLNPDNFEFFSNWQPKKYCVTLGVRPKFTHTVTIEGRDFLLLKNNSIGITNSLKYPADKFSRLATEAGFKSLAQLSVPDNPMVMHILKVDSDQ